jgi:membrane fusion protein (multidrug efflux system)
MNGIVAGHRPCGAGAPASALLAALLLIASPQGPGAQTEAGPAPAVTVAPVTLEPVTRHSSYVGTVVAIQQVDLRAQVEGLVASVNFKEGSFLKAGSLAFGIDKKPYQASLDNAKASLEVAQASKAAAEANLSLAEVTLQRQMTLVRTNDVAQSTVDQAKATRDVNAAQVKQADAQISQAQAQVEAAQINLSYTDITTPISGRIGKAQVTLGNLVSPSSGPLATVIQTDPIRVVFSIADTGYLAVVKALKPNDEGAGLEKGVFVPKLRLSDGTLYPAEGRITFIDNVVDSSTGTIAVYADFPNPNLLLVPGQFVDVSIEVGTPQTLPVVPAAAVQQDQDGTYVFVLGEGNRAMIRRIKTGERVGTDWSVTSGLAHGEMVIVSGIQKLRAGAVVAPSPAASGG